MLFDKDIREPLFEYLEEHYGKIRILEEKTMGNSRADVVMVMEKSIVGVEIKSDADTYTRLNRQIKDYDKYYDMNIVAVGSTHGNNISKHVPEYWGIITVEIIDGKIDFYCLRKPVENPKKQWDKKLEILWKPELAEIQRHFGMAKYKDKSKQFVIRKICEKVLADREEELSTIVSEILFERDYNNIDAFLKEYRK